MNKSQFVSQISQNCGISKSKCNEIFKEAYLLICLKLKQGSEVNLRGFGKFFVKVKKERYIKSLNDKRLKLVIGGNVCSFKISKAFKAIIK